jgi:pimeloyl-[acyl-carrier protein] methyl ester esterase
MGMKILALSGWGQPHDTLGSVAPTATHFDYAGYDQPEDALKAIAKAARGHDAVIGWSLGGQLAVRGIAAGLMQPKKLVLIGVPFQFVRSEEARIGMPRDKFQKFRDNYMKNPQRTLNKAWELVALNDKNPHNIKAQFEKYDHEEMLGKNWLRWLDLLDGFSCLELDFSGFPPSLLLHGAQDAVVDAAQAQEFEKRIPQARNIILGGAGHAPHWHDAGLVSRYIKEHLHV